MNLHNIIERATDFGTFRSRENFISFSLKCIFYIIPAIILGNYEKRCKTLFVSTFSKS